jgi:SAM-dependent methyltransferase
MARTQPFEEHHADYERWFQIHEHVYRSELHALRAMVPRSGRGVEIGVGTGRFAAPLDIGFGVDPSAEMRRWAHRRGIEVVGGIAESLPLRDASFDYALVVTTICFVDDATAMFAEIRRILAPGGTVVVGLVDRDSDLGRVYEKKKEDNPFYRVATFYSTDEVMRLMTAAGFDDIEAVQTVFGPMADVDRVQPFLPGYGEGGFVVLAAKIAPSG